MSIPLYDDYGVYRPFLQRLTDTGIFLDAVRADCIARKSDETTALALEQAGKAFAVMARTEPDLQELLERHAIESWLDPEVRAELNVIDLRLCDITPLRFTDGTRHGTEIIGHLLAVGTVAVLIVANSGFTSIYDPEKHRRNPYAELVIQLLKATRQAAGEEAELRLRLANDRTRKGRLAVELGRMDDFRARLRFGLWYGGEEMTVHAWQRLIESLTNENNENQRTTTVTNFLTGRLSAISGGNLPAAEANLPMLLRHHTDPHEVGLDQRVRTSGGHLVTCHAVEIQPALREYLTAFASGASDRELAVILRKHRVPTPSQTTSRKKNGQRRTSAQRDTTYDRIPFTEAIKRARRWIIHQDHRLAPLPSGGDEQVELSNRLAVRKLQLVAEGRGTLTWKNPTPTETRYDSTGGTAEVKRTSSFDDGHLEPDFEIGFPHQRVLTTKSCWIDATGAPHDRSDAPSELREVDVQVVTNELVLDEHGEPVPWTGWGIDATVIWLAAERLWERHTAASPATHTNGRAHHDRLLGRIEGWWVDEDGERTAQWQLWRRGSTQHTNQQVFRHRWLIWRDRTEALDEHGTVTAWSPLHDGLANKSVSDASRDYTTHHVATFNERHVLLQLVEAMKGAVRSYLDGDLELQSPATADREVRLAAKRAAIQTELDSLVGQAAAAKQAIKDADLMAARAAAKDQTQKAAEYDRDSQAATIDHDRLLALTIEKDAALDRVDDNQIDEVFGPDAFCTVADLIALLAKAAQADWATRRGPGELPADLARLVAAMFTDWTVSRPEPDADGTSRGAWACSWMLTMCDGTVRSLPLSGTWTNTKHGIGAKNGVDAEIVRRMLVDGATYDEITKDLVVATSKAALWANRVRPLLTQWGLPTSLRAPLYDNPSPTTKQIVAVRLGGAPRLATPRWTRGLEDHLAATYDGTRRTRWNESAVPTDTTAMHTVFEMVAQHPAAGVAQIDLAAAQHGGDVVAKTMITPVAGKKATQPQMLRWRDTGVVGLLPCPHADCGVPGSYADFLLYLPETTPGTDGSIGGVLCRACRRLPRTDMAEVRFTEDYLDLGRLSGSGYRQKGASIAEGITHRLQELTVAAVPAATHGSIARITREFDLTRPQAKQLVKTLQPVMRKTAPAGAVQKLYDLTCVRTLNVERHLAV